MTFLAKWWQFTYAGELQMRAKKSLVIWTLQSWRYGQSFLLSFFRKASEREVSPVHPFCAIICISGTFSSDLYLTVSTFSNSVLVPASSHRRLVCFKYS